MATLAELSVERTTLTGKETWFLGRLVDRLQLLADLSFADLLMASKTTDGTTVILAQVRPYTAPTRYPESQVGLEPDQRAKRALEWALDQGEIVKKNHSTSTSETIPVNFQGKIVAAIFKETTFLTGRPTSPLEQAYLETAESLANMIVQGSFPTTFRGQKTDTCPRVGDGLIKVSPSGKILYASPNAVSLYRRLGVSGNLVGRRLTDLVLPDKVYATLLKEKSPFQREVEQRGITFVEQTLPLIEKGRIKQTLILLKDITDLRERERLLKYKESAIKEIHHRVKNNLQTVASLLRLQARRLRSPEAKLALEESVNRIGSIALVHETLSFEDDQAVDFTRVARRLVSMVAQGMLVNDNKVRLEVYGESGFIDSQIATPMALAITELVQNAVEHAFPNGQGEVHVSLHRGDHVLQAQVSDTGRGLPPDFRLEKTSSLGLSIVQTLILDELQGELLIGARQNAEDAHSSRGTCIDIRVPLTETGSVGRRADD